MQNISNLIPNRCCSIKLHVDQNKLPPCTPTLNRKSAQLWETNPVQVSLFYLNTTLRTVHTGELTCSVNVSALLCPTRPLEVKIKRICCQQVWPHRYASKCPLTSFQPREEKHMCNPFYNLSSETHAHTHTLPRPRKLISSGSPAPLAATGWWQSGRQQQFSRRVEPPAVRAQNCAHGPAETRF